MNKNPNDSLQCAICYQKYNKQLIPVSLPQCGHTFCKECISQVLNSMHIPNCPFCKKEFIVLHDGTYLLPKINYAILGILEDSYLFGACEQHCTPNEYLCIDDQQYACSKCCIVGKHQGHQNMEIEVVKHEHDNKLKSLETAYKKMDESITSLNTMLGKREMEALETTDSYFDGVETLIKKQRQEWKSKITQVYREEKKRINVQTAMNQHGKKTLEQKISEYKVITPQILCSARNEDIQELLQKCGNKQLQENISSYITNLNELSGQLANSFESQPPKLLDLQFPERLVPNNELLYPCTEESNSKYESCLYFEFFDSYLNIEIRKTQQMVDNSNFKAWKEIQNICVYIENIWISTKDFELLELLLSNFNQIHSISIEFGNELIEPIGQKYTFQKEIANLLRVLFQDKRQIADICLVWRSSRGGQAALDFLTNQVLGKLPNLRNLDMTLYKTKLDQHNVYNYNKI